MQPSLQDLALGDKEPIPALAQGSQALQGWQRSWRDGHIWAHLQPFPKPSVLSQSPFWGVCCLPLHWGCVWSSRGGQEAKLCHLFLCRVPVTACLRRLLFLWATSEGKLMQVGESMIPRCSGAHL